MYKISYKLLILIFIIVLSCLSYESFAETPLEFGLHGAKTVSAIPEINAHEVRLAGVKWESIEPSKGEYYFDGIDSMIRNFSYAEIKLIIITLRAISSWGGNEYAMSQVVPGDPTTAYSGFPKDMSAWIDFVNKVVERYDGDGINDMPGLTIPVKYWQIEAEWLWQWVDTKENLVEFLGQTSAVIRQTDPAAKIISPAFTGIAYLALVDGMIPEGYVEAGDNTDSPIQVTADMIINTPEYNEARNNVEYLLDEGRYYFDIVDFHTYTREASIITPQKEWLKNTTVGMGYDIPIWTLENGGPFYGYTDKKHSEEVIKRYVTSFASGIERVFWSSLDPTQGFSQNYLRLALISEMGEKKPAYYTYKLMAAKLENRIFDRKIPTKPNIYLYKFISTTGTKPIYIAWADEEGIPLTFNCKAKRLIITHIITEQGQTEPVEEIVEVVGGRVTLYSSTTPVFIEVE